MNEGAPDDVHKVRAFIGFGLPAAVAAVAARRQARLREAWGASRVGWSDPGNFHLTLVFLGELDGPRLGEAQRVLRAVAPVRPAMRLTLGAPAAFPNPARPRVLVLRVGDEAGGLSDLHAALVKAYAPLGYKPNHPVFFPHVTLGHVHHADAPAPGLTEAVEPPVTWRADRLSLFVGRETPAGLRYLPVDTRVFGG